MKIIVQLVLLSSLLGCQSLPRTTKEMWKRSNYKKQHLGNSSFQYPQRSRKVEKVYIGERLLPSGDMILKGEAVIAVENGELLFEGY